MWIIFGKSDNRLFSWPILQVTSTTVKLFCPMEKYPRIATEICTLEPSAHNKKMKVLAPLPVKPLQFIKDGKAVGTSIETIEILAQWINFKPEFHLIYKNADALFQALCQGKGDLGSAISISDERFNLVDYTTLEAMNKILYMVPKAQPVDVFYQFVTPFQPFVWMIISCFCLIFWVILTCTVRFIEFKAKKYDIRKLTRDSKTFEIQTVADYLICTLLVILAPIVNDLKWLVIVFKHSLTGKVILSSLAIYGFFISILYKNILLSHLMAVGYAKQIQTVQGTQFTS